MKPNDKVSIIIVNKDRKENMQNCLNSVIKQDYPLKEIIVVDNNSADSSCQMIKTEFPKVILIENKKNMGACIARNQAIKKSAGDYIWFLDNDSVAMKNNILSSMMQLIKEKKVGAVGGELWIENGVQKGIKKRILLKNGESIWQYIKLNNQIIKSDYLSTANFLTSKNLLYKIGGFNNVYFYLYEDIDISYKFRKLGLNLISNKNTLIHHKEIQDSARTTNFFKINKSRIIFIILNFGIFYFFILPVLDIFYLFNFQKIKILKEKGKANNNPSNKRQNFILRIIKMGSEYLKGLCFSYVWILLNLHKVVKSKNKDYLS